MVMEEGGGREMSCGEKFETIGAYLDGELAGAELEAFREHLTACADCRRELAEQEKLWALLTLPVMGESTSELTERILSNTTRSRRGVLTPMRLLRWGAPMAAAAALLVAVLTMHPSFQHKSMDAETMAVIEKLDVLEHLDVLENMDLLQESERQPILIEDPETAVRVLEEDGS
jgi:anti-sigma factor RsiW